jgi:hypothetical protein
MKRYTRKQKGGNFKCPTIAGESAQNNMTSCKMAALQNEANALNTQTGGRRKKYLKKRTYKRKKTRKTKHRKRRSIKKKRRRR